MSLAKNFTFVAAAVFAGCVNIEKIAPPVSQAMISAASKQHVAPAHLEKGRNIYLRQCTECHNLKSLEDFSPARKQQVLDDMIHRAKLSGEDKQSLVDYLRFSQVNP